MKLIWKYGVWTEYAEKNYNYIHEVHCGGSDGRYERLRGPLVDPVSMVVTHEIRRPIEDEILHEQ